MDGQTDRQTDGQTDVGHINLIGGLVTRNPPNKNNISTPQGGGHNSLIGLIIRKRHCVWLINFDVRKFALTD